MSRKPMNSENDRLLQQQVLTMRIILMALAMGLLVFGFVVNAILGPAEAPADDASRTMVWVGLFMGFTALVIHRLVGSFVTSQGAQNLPPDETAARRQLLMGQQAGMIVSAAILEGAAFACLVFYGFIAGDRMLLMMAGLLWMAIVIKFPFPDGVQAQVDSRLHKARGLSSMRGD